MFYDLAICDWTWCKIVSPNPFRDVYFCWSKLPIIQGSCGSGETFAAPRSRLRFKRVQGVTLGHSWGTCFDLKIFVPWNKQSGRFEFRRMGKWWCLREHWPHFYSFNWHNLGEILSSSDAGKTWWTSAPAPHEWPQAMMMSWKPLDDWLMTASWAARWQYDSCETSRDLWDNEWDTILIFSECIMRHHWHWHRYLMIPGILKIWCQDITSSCWFNCSLTHPQHERPAPASFRYFQGLPAEAKLCSWHEVIAMQSHLPKKAALDVKTNCKQTRTWFAPLKSGPEVFLYLYTEFRNPTASEALVYYLLGKRAEMSSKACVWA